MFNLAIDSKLPECDLTRLLVRDVCQGNGMMSSVNRTKVQLRYGQGTVNLQSRKRERFYLYTYRKYQESTGTTVCLTSKLSNLVPTSRRRCRQRTRK